MTVVVPTYNRRDLLERTLDSLATLDPPADEVIVVSDGSTDGTDELVHARGITLLRSDHRGAAAARNVGWRHGRGEVVAFIDDDCTASTDWLASLIEPFGDESVGLVQGRTAPAGPVGRFDRSIDVASEYGLYESCNIAYRRTALEQVGGFDEAFVQRIQPRVGLPGRRGGRPFAEDTHLAYRVRRAGWRSVFADRAVVEHVVFPGSLRESLAEEWRKGSFTMVVGEIPELRERFAGGRYFLRKQSPLAQAALLGLVLVAAGRRRLGAALLVPYLAWVVRGRTPSAAAEQAARDVVCSTSLLVGSAKTGRLLL